MLSYALSAGTATTIFTGFAVTFEYLSSPSEKPEVTNYAEENPARVRELIALHKSWIRNLDKGQ